MIKLLQFTCSLNWKRNFSAFHWSLTHNTDVTHEQIQLLKTICTNSIFCKLDGRLRWTLSLMPQLIEVVVIEHGHFKWQVCNLLYRIPYWRECFVSWLASSLFWGFWGVEIISVIIGKTTNLWLKNRSLWLQHFTRQWVCRGLERVSGKVSKKESLQQPKQSWRILGN